MRTTALALITALGLAACARSHVAPVPASQVSPAASPDTGATKQICIVENPRVRQDFLDSYRAALQAKGFAVTVVPKNPQASTCPLYTRYVAHWAWDLVVYLRFAQLDIYREGKQVGQAIHDARSSRFIDTEAKIKELVNQLFP
jgi:hypothetical protein